MGYPNPGLSDPKSVADWLSAERKGLTLAEYRAQKAARAQKGAQQDLEAHAKFCAPNPRQVAQPDTRGVTGTDLHDGDASTVDVDDVTATAQGAKWRQNPNINRPPWDGGPARSYPSKIDTERGPVATKGSLTTKSDYADALDDEATAHAQNLRAIATSPHFTDTEKKRATKRAVDAHAERTVALSKAMKSVSATFDAAKANDVDDATAVECIESIRVRKPISQLRAERITPAMRSTGKR